MSAAVSVLLVCAPAPARAETPGQRAARLIDQHNLVLKTDGAPVFEEWSTDCGEQTVILEKFGGPPDASLQARWARLPLPCYFDVSQANDHDAIFVWHGADPRYCEFWLGRWASDNSGGHWRAAWGGCARENEFTWGKGARAFPENYGTASSSIAMIPGVITAGDLAAGRIDHVLRLAVPETCGTWKPPAAGTDYGSSGTFDENLNCLENGTLLKLPAHAQPITWGGPPAPLAVAITDALKRHGAIVADQTHSAFALYAEGWNVRWGKFTVDWSTGRPADPYPELLTRGYPCEQYPRYCTGWGLYPDAHNQLEAVPWAMLEEAAQAPADSSRTASAAQARRRQRSRGQPAAPSSTVPARIVRGPAPRPVGLKSETAGVSVVRHPAR